MRSLKWLTEVKREITIPGIGASLTLIIASVVCGLNNFTNPIFSVIISFEAGIIFTLSFCLFILNAAFGEHEETFKDANDFLDSLASAPAAVMNTFKSQKIKIIDNRTKGSAKRPVKIIGEKGEEY